MAYFCYYVLELVASLSYNAVESGGSLPNCEYARLS